jgi:Ca2+-binding EF-hand superfamily protein
MSKFSSNGRSVRYREFIKAFSFKEAREGDQDIVRILSDGFRLNTETRSGSQNIAKALKEEFSRYDVKNNGQIMVSEFKRGLQSLQIDLTESELRKVVRRFDRDGSGFVDYKEIIDMIQYNSDSDGERVRSRGTSREGRRGESREGMREERRERDDGRGEVRNREGVT